MREDIQILELAPNENIINLYGWEFTYYDMLNFEFGKSYITNGSQFTYLNLFTYKSYPFHIIYVGNGNFYVNKGNVIEHIIIKSA